MERERALFDMPEVADVTGGKGAVLGGAYRLRLDTSGRFVFPMEMRGVVTNRFMLFPLGAGIVMYDERRWDAISICPAGSSEPRSPQEKLISRLIFARVFPGGFGTRGRVYLPRPIRDHAGIERELLLIGVGDYVEIWEPATFVRKAEEERRYKNKAGGNAC